MSLESLAKLGQAVLLATIVGLGVLTIVVIREAEQLARASIRDDQAIMRNGLRLERAIQRLLQAPRGGPERAAASKDAHEALEVAKTLADRGIETQRIDELFSLLSAAETGEVERGPVLRALDRLEDGLLSQRANQGETTYQRLQEGVGQVTVACGFGLLVVFLLGGWSGRNVTRPLRRYEDCMLAMVSGNSFRRAPDGETAGVFRNVSTYLNRLADELQVLKERVNGDELVVRAALASLLANKDGPGGLLDRGGRVLVANEALVQLIRERGVTPAQLLGREPNPRLVTRETREVRESGVLRGYLLLECRLSGAASTAPVASVPPPDVTET